MRLRKWDGARLMQLDEILLDMDIKQLRKTLLDWYRVSRRDFPWRHTRDPFRIWVSEVMLQQTRTETVLRYYEPFLEKFPDVNKLAEADEQQVLKAWEGLGYYRRARGLHAGAKDIAERFHGKMPQSMEKLLRVSGIGMYTAGAVASIAYGEAVPAVDGNAVRVFSRLTGYDACVDTTVSRKLMQALGEKMVDPDLPGDWNQAIMDLGACICRNGQPDCAACPVLSLCRSGGTSMSCVLPIRAQKKEKPVEYYDVLLCFSPDHRYVAVRQRTENLLGGLWTFPMIKREGNQEDEHVAGMPAQMPEGGRSLGHARHVFTHLIWEMNIVECSLAEDQERVSREELEQLPFPSAMKKALALCRGLMK